MSNRLKIAQNRVSTHDLLAKLKDSDDHTSKSAASGLIKEAKEANLSMRDYLTLKVDVNKDEDFKGSDLNGYQASLAYLNLPIRDDFKNGILLEAAADTFQTYSGTRALFPEVIDDLIQWKYRQDNFENVANIVGNSRTVSQAEVLSTVVDDAEGDYNFTSPIAEGSNVPVRFIKTSQQTVGLFKHGSGLNWTYEFERRASIDIITPYAARIQREKEISKVSGAVGLLVNGVSGVASLPAAAVVAQSTLKPAGGGTSAAGQINWACFFAWIVSRAKKGVPIDTVVGNWDTYLQWSLMFTKPELAAGPSASELLARTGTNISTVNPNLLGNIRFAVASGAPANQLIGFSQADTVEELVENGSQIKESERSISNQTVDMVLTDTAGYRLVFGDTREILNLDAVS